MDAKAANRGDRLKHGILLEVLDRLDGWPFITYAETHAGAGIYGSNRQAETNHIAELRNVVLRSLDVSGGGRAHLEHLRHWWSGSAHEEDYPGSAVSSARFLLQRYPDKEREFRLTEVAPDSFHRLCAALAEYDRPIKMQVRQDSFRDHGVWLTGKENLVLLVDPFGCGDWQSREEAEPGHIDVRDLGWLLNAIRVHERAVVIFWTWYGAKLASARPAIERTLYSEKGANVRQYSNGNEYWVYVLGVGAGAGVVESLPSEAVWKKSSNGGELPVFTESKMLRL